MALVVKDRIQVTSTTTGTGTFTLGSAVAGFQDFSVIGNGNTTYYAIVGGSEWEVGLGTYTSSGTTLSRDTILESSNGGTAVNFSAGTKTVFVTYPAEKGLYLDASGNAIALGTPASATLTNATGLPLSTGVTGTLPIANGGTGTTSTTFANLTTNVTGTLPVANGGTGITSLGTGVATFLGTPSSANLASAVTDETGSGALVFGTSPTIASPTFTSQATFAAGTAALPAITTTGDTNTGMFFPAADTIAFAEGGVEAMRIDSNGNVGIGATSLSNAGTPNERTFTISGTNFPQLYHIATATAANNTTWRNIARNTAVYQLQITNDAVSTEQTVYEVSRSANSVSYQRWFGGTTEAMRIDSSGNFKFNSGYGSVATAYGCRAWVNFNGTANTNLTGTYTRTSPSTTLTVTATAHGLIVGSSVNLDFTTGTGLDGIYTVVTVADANTFTVTTVASTTTSGNVTLLRNTIRGSGNVSSITDNGTGDYTINFTNAMPDANYATGTNYGNTGGSVVMKLNDAIAPTTAAVRVITLSSSAYGAIDVDQIHLSVFR